MTTTHLTLTCHCHNFTHRLLLPTASALPLKSSLCSCTSCRHVTGQLFATFAVIPGPTPDASLTSRLARFDSSETLQRWFCPVCGASVLNVDFGVGGVGEWEVGTGCLEFEGEEGEKDGKGEGLEGKLDRVGLWTEDTRDGGAVRWLRGGREDVFKGRYHMRGRDSEVVTEALLAEMLEKRSTAEPRGGESENETQDVLYGQCHPNCGQVKVQISRPDNGGKHTAEFCCCNSCRKTSGFEVTSWTHISKDKVKMANGDPYTVGMKSMGRYVSSKDTERYFCQRCGATVFYDRPNLARLDVALGLFDAVEGSRADNWFQWNPDKEDVAYLEDAVDKDFVGRLADGVGSQTRKEGEQRVSGYT